MSSWIRNAVNLAVEAGTGNTLTRTVRNYADTVVLHAGNAVAGGARLILPDRIGPRNLQSFKHTVKRLEEVSVSCRGVERVQLLRRWLVALKEIERLSAIYIDSQEKNHDDQIVSDPENPDSPKRPTLVYYVDAETGDEPRTFRDVFLHSQALEGITLSMILEEPTEEEVSLLLEIYRLCLTGGRDVHGAVMSSVQNLAKALSSYVDEVLIKREELLQLAQNAISGLKINADLTRLDAQICSIRKELDKLMATNHPLSESYNKSSETEKDATVEHLKTALVEIQLCSRLESLLLKKKSLSNGDSADVHMQKVDKLKVLSESLANSTSKAEKRILDHRSQKEEALNFRAAKANEVSQLEKDLVAEIAQTEKQKEELEEALKKVVGSLNVLRGRLRNAREEREQFDEASNQIIIHLKSKEDELSRSMQSCRAEVDVVNTWICFLQDTWFLQASLTEEKEKQVNDELEKYGGCFVNLVIDLLSTYKESLRSSIMNIRSLAERLSLSEGSSIPLGKDDGGSNRSNPRKKIEEEYVDVEAKLLTTLSVVDTMNRQFFVQTDGIYRKDGENIKELFDELKKIEDEFETIERPILVIEASPKKPETPPSEGPCLSPTPMSTPLGITAPFFNRVSSTKFSLFKKEKKDDPPLATNKAPLSPLNENKKSDKNVEPELYRGLDIESREGSAEFEITDWVFDDPGKTGNTPKLSKTASAKENITSPTKDIATALEEDIATSAPTSSNESATAKEIATSPTKELTAPNQRNVNVSAAVTLAQENIPSHDKEIITNAAVDESTANVTRRLNTNLYE